MIRGVALALTVVTGFAGLVYEVAWQRYLAALLGSHAEAISAVLAIFLGGLALGYAVFGRISRRIARGRLLVAYGAVEHAPHVQVSAPNDPRAQAPIVLST